MTAFLIYLCISFTATAVVARALSAIKDTDDVFIPQETLCLS